MEFGKELRYLSYDDVAAINLPMMEIIDILESAFVEKFYSRIEMPPKPGIHPSGDAFIHAMPCWLPKHNAAGIKWVSGYPQNKPKGLPYISGLMIMNDPQTGIPICVLDARWITAMRTAAVTGLCARYMANQESESIGFIGCGVQARANLEALLAVCTNIKRVYAYDHHSENIQTFILQQSKKYSIEFLASSTAKDAIIDSDIVVTSGPIKLDADRVIEASWIKPGAMLAPLDFDCMFKAQALETVASHIFVDDIGQYQHFKSVGYFKHSPEILPEVCRLIGKELPSRNDNKEIMLAINIGMALDDVSTAARIISIAQEKNIGKLLPL